MHLDDIKAFFDGTLFLTDSQNGLWVVDGDTGEILKPPGQTGLTCPAGCVVITASDNLFVENTGSSTIGTVMKGRPSGNACNWSFTGPGGVSSQFRSLSGLVNPYTENIPAFFGGACVSYASGTNTYNTEGWFSVTGFPNINVSGAAADAAGNVYKADSNNGAIHAFNLTNDSAGEIPAMSGSSLSSYQVNRPGEIGGQGSDRRRGLRRD